MVVRRWLVVLAVLLVGPLVLAACGGGDESGAGSSTFNDADVNFAQGMIAHHEQAIEMSDIALDPAVGASAEVRDLAGRIKAAQDPEIQTMTGWLAAWDKPTGMDHEGHDMSTMAGMMSAADMDALGKLKGVAFDREFYRMMIAHHEGAVSMARDVQRDGVNPDVRTLTEGIVASQTGEIEEMRAALK